MIKLVMVICCCCVSAFSAGQDLALKLKNAFARLEADSQLRYGIAAIHVIDLSSGKLVFGKNSHTGLAAASTQKIITAASAFALLGKEFRYTTIFGYTGPVRNGTLHGNMIVNGSGDPTLGSSRYPGTGPAVIGAAVRNKMASAGIKNVEGHLIAANHNIETQTIPNGWIWEDIGNYYGAGMAMLNWNENAYDIWLKPGQKEGETVSILKTRPAVPFRFIPELLTGKRGSGDQAWIYFNPGKQDISIRGTIPCCVDSFRIAGAVPAPEEFALSQLAGLSGIDYSPDLKLLTTPAEIKPLYTHLSPPLDSISYWFLNKSINLYGEALIRTIGSKVKNKGTTIAGLEAVKEYWQEKGIQTDAIHIFDGSGLSPSNRVTASSLTAVLNHAFHQNWFSSFREGFPVVNGMHMKSGTIEGVRAYTGYARNRAGKSYAFAIIVNNYSGSTSTITRKMLAVLEEMK